MALIRCSLTKQLFNERAVRVHCKMGDVVAASELQVLDDGGPSERLQRPWWRDAEFAWARLPHSAQHRLLPRAREAIDLVPTCVCSVDEAKQAMDCCEPRTYATGSVCTPLRQNSPGAPLWRWLISPNVVLGRG